MLWNALVLLSLLPCDLVLYILISDSCRRTWVSFQSSFVISFSPGDFMYKMLLSCPRCWTTHYTPSYWFAACRLLIDKHPTCSEMLIKVVKLLCCVPKKYFYYWRTTEKYAHQGTHAQNIKERDLQCLLCSSASNSVIVSL